VEILPALELTAIDWLLAATCALLVGFSKTGVTGMGIVIVPTMAMIFPAQQSPGVLLPMLIMGDVMAVGYYHRHAVWSHLLRLMPWAVIGILVAFAVLKFISWDDKTFSKLLGAIVLICIGSTFLRGRENSVDSEGDAPGGSRVFAVVMGILGGIATMIANAAGSIWSIYLLAVGLPKYQFVGTGAWFYLILNSFKVPLQINLGNINASTVAFNFAMLPAIVLGGVIGIFLLPKINQKIFNRLILALAAAAGLKLLLM
jgi:hypothetical protein